jgi:hypothetical protein
MICTSDVGNSHLTSRSAPAAFSSPLSNTTLTLSSSRAGQGIEQQKLWLNIEEKDLPLPEIFESVRKQLEDDAKTGNEPPEQ